MSLYYFDTSALVKYYVTEPGSTWVRQLVDQTDADTGQPVNTIFITEISLVEVASALAILNRVGRITRRDRDRAYRNFMNDAWRLFDLLSLVTADFLTAGGLTPPSTQGLRCHTTDRRPAPQRTSDSSKASSHFC